MKYNPLYHSDLADNPMAFDYDTDDMNTAYPPYLPNEDGDIEFPLLGGYHPASEESRAAFRAVAKAKKHEDECND